MEYLVHWPTIHWVMFRSARLILSYTNVYNLVAPTTFDPSLHPLGYSLQKPLFNIKIFLSAHCKLAQLFFFLPSQPVKLELLKPWLYIYFKSRFALLFLQARERETKSWASLSNSRDFLVPVTVSSPISPPKLHSWGCFVHIGKEKTWLTEGQGWLESSLVFQLFFQ